MIYDIKFNTLHIHEMLKFFIDIFNFHFIHLIFDLAFSFYLRDFFLI